MRRSGHVGSGVDLVVESAEPSRLHRQAFSGGQVAEHEPVISRTDRADRAAYQHQARPVEPSPERLDDLEGLWVACLAQQRPLADGGAQPVGAHGGG